MCFLMVLGWLARWRRWSISMRRRGRTGFRRGTRLTGEPVWVVDVMDFDPDARERTFKVKIAAPVQPVPPAEVGGLPVRPVRLEGLTVTPYLKESAMGRPRIAYSLRATGLAEVRRGDGKAA